MTPARRWVLGGTLTLAGGLAAAIGSAQRWFTVSSTPRFVTVPDVGRAELPRVSFVASGTDVAGPATSLVILLVLAAALAFLASGRLRAGLVAVALGAAVGAFILAFTVDADDARTAAPDTFQGEITVSAGPGKPTTLAGSGVAVLAAGWALPVAAAARRARIPERAPDEDRADERAD